MKTSQVLTLSFLRHQIEKRIRTLPEIDGLSKETVVTSWMSKYDFIMKGGSPLSIFFSNNCSYCQTFLLQRRKRDDRGSGRPPRCLVTRSSTRSSCTTCFSRSSASKSLSTSFCTTRCNWKTRTSRPPPSGESSMHGKRGCRRCKGCDPRCKCRRVRNSLPLCLFRRTRN